MREEERSYQENYYITLKTPAFSLNLMIVFTTLQKKILLHFSNTRATLS